MAYKLILSVSVSSGQHRAAASASHHTRHGWKNRDLPSYSSGAWKSKVRVWSGLVSPKLYSVAFRESPLCVFTQSSVTVPVLTALPSAVSNSHAIVAGTLKISSECSRVFQGYLWIQLHPEILVVISSTHE